MYKRNRSRVYDSPKEERLKLLNEIEKIKIEHNFSAVSQSVFNIAFFCIIKLFQNEEKGKMEYIQTHTNTHKPPASKTTDQKKTN